MSSRLKFTFILITFFIGLSSAFSAQAATQIFRSVGPSATGALANDGSHARTVTVASGTATFSVGLREDIGVGDAVLIDTGGTDQAIDASDTLLFIHSRTSSTSYTLRTHTGATPSDISINDTYQIYRAYTSLANAEAGTKNTSIPIAFNGGDRDLVTNDEEWNIACYANGTTADTTAVTVDGWNTGTNNFIRIFTPVSATEVGASQRHDGKWDENKYRLAGTVTGSDTGMMIIQDLHVRIDGLQMRLTGMTADSQAVLLFMNQTGLPEVYAGNNIIRGEATVSYSEHFGIIFYYDPAGGKGYIYNNIIYDFGYNNANSAGAAFIGDGTRYFYSNTIHNTYHGFFSLSTNTYLKNNITQNCLEGYNGTPNSSSDYNLSDLASDGPSPSYRYGLATEVTFVDEANDDFHLAQTDPYAKDFGTNLSSDTYLPFSTDIDGATRTSVTAWDIGADETATRIFRSVGPSATGLLTSDTAHARTITLTGGVATFSVALPDNIGVGDAVIIDTGGTDQTIDASDTLLFIHSRTSSTSYTLRTHTGATPSDIPINDTWQIYRAYTSLANAEAGTKNTSIPITFNGGNRDLVTNNEEWNIACYANGTTADTTAVTIDGWNTFSQNFIKVYTPALSTEVGASQRHGGKWDDNKYNMKFTTTSSWQRKVNIINYYVILDGLQIELSYNHSYVYAIEVGGNHIISNSIVKGEAQGSDIEAYGINIGGGYNDKVFNNIVYGFKDQNNSSGEGIRSGYIYDRLGDYIYNNTVYESYVCFQEYGGGSTYLKNNIAQNCTVGYSGDFYSSSDFNISDISGDAPNATFAGGTADVQFVNEAGYDFHLAQTDTAARGAGANLTADANLPFPTDIDGQLRNPSGAGWDIGADEGTVEFVSTVMQTGGNFSTLSSWEDAIDSDLVADTTRVFSHGGITGTIVGGNTVTGLTSGATATVVYATSTQILLHTVSGIFQSGETVQVSSGNSVVISDNGNPASAVAKIDGAWTVADTTAVDIFGWTSGPDNYIKIYTTPTARHSGKWDDGKYRLEVTATGSYESCIAQGEGFIRYEGLQLKFKNNDYTGGRGGIDIADYYVHSDFTIVKDNIFVSDFNTTNGDGGIDALNLYDTSYTDKYHVLNNIFYHLGSGWSGAAPIAMNIYGRDNLVSNNTIYYPRGIYAYGTTVAKNNIVQNSGDGYNTGSFDASSDYNISNLASDAPSPSYRSGLATTVSFISTTSGAEDFHLAQTDTFAKDAGTDLSTYFSTDIDGATRNASINNWDIGADETATQIFRSVAPGATGLLDSDNSHADLLNSITSGVATFEVAVADNIGVGDVLIVDTNNDEAITSADTLLFISGRNSSTSYNLQTNDGAIPSDIPINDTWQIYRAYTSLANAEAGTTINSGISSLGFSAFTGGDRDLLANNEEWNIACYANGTTADSTAVNIDGWNTGAYNFIKAYTPVNMNEVGVSQRHDGKWNTSKYYLQMPNAVIIQFSESEVGNVFIDGLQIYLSGINANDQAPIYPTYSSGGSDVNIRISNNILRGPGSSSYYTTSIDCNSGDGNSAGTIMIWNNVIYDFSGSNGEGIALKTYTNIKYYIYNNTLFENGIGIVNYFGSAVVKNNLVQNCTDGFSGTFDASSDFNISDISGDAPNATFTGGFAEVQFIDEANKDFHLSQSDTSAKDAGTDLSTYFTTDIDGATRNASITAWDIGADETATRIFRSVGPSKTTTLANDSSHANTITLTSGVATFSAALADNIGVGDAVIIDTGGTDQAIDASDTLLFIHSRTSSTSYTLRTHTGSVPGDIAINDTYSIYRAYTSLYNAEAGTKNTSIPITFNGGNRDLVTNNEEWNIACYANGTTADTAINYVDINGWTTGYNNFVKIYTPFSINEVGVSQRHSGKWDVSKYYYYSTFSIGIRAVSRNVWLDGLQVHNNNDANISEISAVTVSYNWVNLILSNSILRGPDINIYSNTRTGLLTFGNKGTSFRVYNNISYNWGYSSVNQACLKIAGDSSVNAWIYNNTTSGCYVGIRNYATSVFAKNNIVQNCTDGYNGTFDASSDYNISDISGDAPNATFAGGTADVQFVNEAGYDFHLAQTDTAARGAGVNLTADANLPFSTDIDGQLRNPSGAGWDIGADEGTVEFVSTVMQSGGNFSTLSSWEDAIDSDLVANTTRVFSHGGITGTIVGGNTVTGLTSGATATVVYATSTQILLHTVSGIFQSGETLEVTAGNSVVISDNGNPASAVAKIDGAWTAADTTAVYIDGWTSGPDNYIKIYTAPDARHSGKWDEGKYRLQVSGQWAPSFYLFEDFLFIDGVQIAQLYDGSLGAGEPYLIRTSGAVGAINRYNSRHQISNNIIKAHQSHSVPAQTVQIITAADVWIFNNIIIDAYYGINNAIWSNVPLSKRYIYNNTIINPKNIGITADYNATVTGLLYLKNNIVQGTNANYNIGSSISYLYDYQASHNISSDSTAPGSSGSKINAEVKFISTEAGNEDFHLHPDDRFAKDAGTDLSTYFTNDIDGQTRLRQDSGVAQWDIGADETATRIYRSVGPSKNDTLDNDTGHTKNVTLTAGVATFSAPLPDNVGVGDVVIIDTNNDEAITSADTLLFISKRNSSTTYQLQTHTGATPSDITINDTYQIYRAHTSLANAEAGTINSTLSTMGFTFNGGNRDLVANNEQWNIVCYANGTTADDGVSITGWTTSHQNYIKLYTPVSSDEVGVSQRHRGVWDNNKYSIFTSAVNGVHVYDKYVKVDGLQIKTNGNWRAGFWVENTISQGSIYISNNLITTTDYWGIFSGFQNKISIYASNNIIYDSVAGGIYQYAGNALSYYYNNTINGMPFGFGSNGSMSAILVNNITQNCTDGYSGTFDASSDYNISDLAADAPGTNSKNSTNVLFLDEANDDFRLSSDDTAAKGAGLNLSTDTDLSFFDDIRGQSRPKAPDAWSIGACEPQGAGKIKLEGTQIKMEGDAKFE